MYTEDFEVELSRHERFYSAILHRLIRDIEGTKKDQKKNKYYIKQFTEFLKEEDYIKDLQTMCNFANINIDSYFNKLTLLIGRRK